MEPDVDEYYGSACEIESRVLEFLFLHSLCKEKSFFLLDHVFSCGFCEYVGFLIAHIPDKYKEGKSCLISYFINMKDIYSEVAPTK